MEGFLGIGGNELLIILIFAFLIFGPDKLPDIARTIGRAIAKFRDAQNEVNEVIRKEVYDPATDAENPFQKATEKAAELNKKPAPKTESFAERKARYDKIRAERKAKEEAAAAEAAAAAGATGAAAATSAASEPAAEPTDADIDALLGVSAKENPLASAAPAEGNQASGGASDGFPVPGSAADGQAAVSVVSAAEAATDAPVEGGDA